MVLPPSNNKMTTNVYSRCLIAFYCHRRKGLGPFTLLIQHPQLVSSCPSIRVHTPNQNQLGIVTGEGVPLGGCVQHVPRIFDEVVDEKDG